MKIRILVVLFMASIVLWGQKSGAVVEKVVDAVYRIEVNTSVNVVAVVEDDGVVLYDAGYKGMGDAIETAVKSITSLPIKSVYNTHYHNDHTGANDYFKSRGVKIYARQMVLDRLSDDEKKGILWDVSDTEKEWIGTHSGSDMTVYLVDKKVFIAADMLFEERFPYIDTAAGGDVTTYLEAQNEIIDLLPDDVKIIAGHGKIYTLEEYETLNSLLWETYDKVKELVMADESLDAIKKADPLADYEHLQWNLVNKDKWIEIIYTSLR